MASRKCESPQPEALKIIQRHFHNLNCSFQTACIGATENAAKLASFMQGQRLHMLSRTAPFAAANLAFARSADTSQKSRKKRKHSEDLKTAKGKEQALDTPSTEHDTAAGGASRGEDATVSRQETKDQQDKKREERRLASERKRSEAEAKRKAADQRKQEAKRRQEEAQRLQQEERRKAQEKEALRAKKAAQQEDNLVQKFLNRELKRIFLRKSQESDFVRSLDDVEFNDDTLEQDTTLTGLRPVMKDEVTEEHNEMMRDVLAEAGFSREQYEDKTLPQLLDEAERERKRAEMSADEPGHIMKSNEEIYDEMRGEDLRPHAHKMQLKPDEHEALELDRFGKGYFLHPKRLLGLVPWGVVHDISWGLFGKIPVVQQRLGPKWGGQDPSAVLQQQGFYDDILNIAPEMEMTVMMVAERDIPLAELRNKFLDAQHIRLRQIMYHERFLRPLAHKHKVLLAKIKLSAMEENFVESGLMDPKGNIKADSKLILVVTEDGALTAEAVTPGTIIEQKVVRLGRWTDTTFARSVMDNFLGLYAADNGGKNAVGHGVLYCANGFDFREPADPATNSRHFYDELDSEEVPDFLDQPQGQEGFTLSDDLFKIEKEHPFIVEDLLKADKKSAPLAQSAA